MHSTWDQFSPILARDQAHWYMRGLSGMSDMGRWLIVVGGLMVAAGVVLMLLGRSGLPLGRLPGDNLYRGKHTTVYFPLATSLLLSVLLSVILYVVSRWKR
jgi:hypothetical protein